MIAMFYILRHQTMRPWLERSSTHFPSQAILQIIFTFPLMAHYGIAGALLASGIIFLYDGTRGFSHHVISCNNPVQMTKIKIVTNREISEMHLTIRFILIYASCNG